MASNINVKVDRLKLIEVIEKKIKTLEKNIAKKEAQEKKIREELIKEKERMFAKVKNQKPESIQVNHRNWNKTIELQVFYVLPKKEKKNTEHTTDSYPYNQKEIKQELENALRLLKLSEQKDINTSSYGRISRYL